MTFLEEGKWRDTVCIMYMKKSTNISYVGFF
jgi:hypothetical protein